MGQGIMNAFEGLKVYGGNWEVVSSRSFQQEELALVDKAEVVSSDYGMSVCFFMKGGGQYYIPVSNQGADPALGSSIDMNAAKLVKLHREGDGNIVRVEL